MRTFFKNQFCVKHVFLAKHSHNFYNFARIRYNQLTYKTEDNFCFTLNRHQEKFDIKTIS